MNFSRAFTIATLFALTLTLCGPVSAQDVNSKADPNAVPLPTTDPHSGETVPDIGSSPAPKPALPTPCPECEEIPVCPPQLALGGSSTFGPRNEFTLGVTPAVPIHEREAEIWFKLPKNAVLTVNFREYTQVGTFCIVKTKIPTRDPRRYYFSARLDEAHKGTPLEPYTPQFAGILGTNELGQTYVDLVPSSHILIDFTCSSSTATVPEGPPSQAINALTESSNRNTEASNRNTEAINRNSEAINRLSESNNHQTESINRITEAVNRLTQEVTRSVAIQANHGSPPAAAKTMSAPELTKAFQFRTTQITVEQHGSASPFDFTALPASVVLSTQDVPPQLASLRNVEASLTLTIRRSNSPNDPHAANLAEGAPIQFVNHSNSYQGTILLADLVHTSLNSYLNSERLAKIDHSDYQIDGTLEFKGVDASSLTGPIGNQIRLRIVK